MAITIVVGAVGHVGVGTAAGAKAGASTRPVGREVGRFWSRLGSMQFSPDGAVLLTTAGRRDLGDETTEVVLYDARTLELIGLEPIMHAGLRRAQFDGRGGKLLTVGCVDGGPPRWKLRSGEAKVWDVRTGKLLVGPIHHGGGPPSDGAMSPDGSMVATCSYEDSVVRLWDAATGRAGVVLAHERNVLSVQFDRSGSTLVSNTDRAVLLWDVRAGRVRAALGDLPRNLSERRPALSGDGRRVAVAGGWEIAVYDLATARQVRVIDAGMHLDESVSDVALSPDGSVVAATTSTGGGAWEVATGRKLFAVPDAYTGCPTFDRRGERVVFDAGESPALWSVGTGRPIALPAGARGWMAAFSPDRDVLGVYVTGGAVTLLDVGGGGGRETGR